MPLKTVSEGHHCVRRYSGYMSPLIPEVRVNKNGVPVTKHVKPPNGGSGTASMPAPQAKTASYGYDLRKRIESHVYEAHEIDLHGYSRLRSLTEIMPWRNMLSDTTLEAYMDTINSRPEDGYADLLLGIFDGWIRDSEACYYLEIAKLDPTQSLAGCSEDDKWGRGDKAFRRAGSIYRGLEYYGGFQYERPSDILNQSGPMVKATQGLIRVTHRLCNEGEGIGIDSSFEENSESPYGQEHIVRLEPPSLAALVADRPDDADRIADIVLSRDTDDPSIILSVLDAGVPQLSNGVL